MDWPQRVRNVRTALELALSDARYAALALVAAPVVFALYFFATSIPGQNLESWLFSIGPVNAALYALLVALIALTLAVQAFAFANRLAVHGKRGLVGGTVAAVFVGGCCTSLFVPILSLGGGALGGVVFYYHTQLIVLSIALIAYALYGTSQDVACTLPKRSA